MTKDLLRRRTEEAVAQRVFGVPATIADGELFWGVDSLPTCGASSTGATR